MPADQSSPMLFAAFPLPSATLRIGGVVSALALMVALTAYTEAHADMTPEGPAPVPLSSPAALSPDAATVDTGQAVSATGLIGQPVYNIRNKKIGILKDIILDKTGAARMVVISDGGFMGMGDKLAAFDYALVMRQDDNGDVIMPLSDKTIGQAAAFSYDPAEASDKVSVIPADGYSVYDLMKGRLVDTHGVSVGGIENITFRSGHASQVVVALDQKMGNGGDRTALDFANLAITRAGDGQVNLRMTPAPVPAASSASSDPLPAYPSY